MKFVLKINKPMDRENFFLSLQSLDISHVSHDRFIESLPFSNNDTTAGSETELQTTVIGNNQSVDLPISIKESNYFKNIVKRSRTGDTSKKSISDLERYLKSNPEGIWDNSWVRFPVSRLNPHALAMLNNDLLANKKNKQEGHRSDLNRYVFSKNGEKHLRLPISYLLKLALTDLLTPTNKLQHHIFKTGQEIINNFVNDNTSPETHSFYITRLWPSNGNGEAIAYETSKRFLMTQLLTQYANKKFGLTQSGQQVKVFHSPLTSIRQKQLNDSISDSFYRELFMNPCLSGWDKGEDKWNYMNLCHQVLSRSQLSALTKLRETGVIANDVVVLPNMSNISLANNGTHLSIGSIKLSQALSNKNSFFTEEHEKYFGDLVLKMFEHFLPLFVGTYTAAPRRMEFYDFHPEKALGFLPHELHPVHLRMIWRRWKKKAKLKFFGKPITPFGPLWLDKTIQKLFDFKGDYVPDFRLSDYLVSLLSTESCPAMDGKLGNEERLKNDLMHMGVFDNRMSLYLFYKLRQHSVMGYSGFEGRHYSLFYDLMEDMAPAANLQVLITLLAFKWMAENRLSHRHIPDDPFTESERRQIPFGTAIGIPTFFVHGDTRNMLLLKIMKKVKRTRSSSRYPGFIRIHNLEYRKALIDVLEEEASDLIELLNLRETIKNLKLRLEFPEEFSALGRLTRGIVEEAGVSSPYKLTSDEFSHAAENYYRDRLRMQHLEQGLEHLKNRLIFTIHSKEIDSEIRASLKDILEDKSIEQFIDCVKDHCLNETASEELLEKIIQLVLVGIYIEKQKYHSAIDTDKDENIKNTSIC